jgi:bifunctional DNA-binding transcriptional regulator/antitoxin component of YhaV-PrlF toxin-antitoxin module
MVVKNTRSKVSPGGVITLPVAARKALGMKPREGAQVTVAVKDDAVELAPAGADGGFRVSARGQMELRGDPRRVLEAGVGRHFWLELNDDDQTVRLHPYE